MHLVFWTCLYYLPSSTLKALNLFKGLRLTAGLRQKRPEGSVGSMLRAGGGYGGDILDHPGLKGYAPCRRSQKVCK